MNLDLMWYMGHFVGEDGNETWSMILFMANDDINLDLRLAPPMVDEQAAPPVVEEPQQPPIIPELPQPLIPDDVRIRELEERLSLYTLEEKWKPKNKISILASQTVIEKKVEAALVLDGLDPERILAKRGQMRGFLFYPQGSSLSKRIYCDYVKSIDLEGTRASIPYKRVIKAIRRSELII